MKVQLKILFLIFLPLLWHATGQYLNCPVFNFQNGIPFRGDSIYNPYKDIFPANWVKCNFHAHSNAWNGVTNGKGTGRDINRIYDSLGYAIHSVSNYQQIDKTGSSEKNYIEAYEHGYNIKKTHHLVLGAKKVEWEDFIFPQTLSNKQWIINTLAEDTGSCIILNHPSIRHGFSPLDLQLLSGYHCMEVLNPVSTSFIEWDAALSAGKPVFIVGNDDTHDVFKAGNIGKCCTWINTRQCDKTNIISSLKKGCSYGMKIPVIGGESIAQKSVRFKNEMPFLKYLKVHSDSIFVGMSTIADSILLIGQNGIVLEKSCISSSISYQIKKQDSYIRTAVYFHNGIQVYLNPVYRYQGYLFGESSLNFNENLTFFLTSAGILIRIFLISILLRYYLRGFFKRFRLRPMLDERNPRPAF